MATLTKKIIFVVFTILTVGFSGLLVKKAIKPYNITSVLKAGDPVLLKYQDHLQKYNDENDLYILLSSSTSWLDREDFYNVVFGVTENLRKISGLETVRSLSDGEYLIQEQGRILLEQFFTRGRLTPEGRQTLEQDPLFRGSFIDDSGKALVVYLKLRPYNPVPLKKEILKSIRLVLEGAEKHPDVKTYFLGTEVARDAFVSEVIKSQSKILPLILLLILGLLYALFRTWKVCFLSLYVMSISYFLTLCLIVLCEGSINPFSSFALLFIFIISTIDIIHLFSAASLNKAPTRDEKIRGAVQHLFKPCFICAVTTVIGLLSLLLAEISPIQFFGLYCSFGVSLSFVLTFYVLPRMISLFDLDLQFRAPPAAIDNLQVSAWVYRWRRPIILSFFIFVAVFGYLSSQLKAADNLYNKFVASHPLSQAVGAFDEKLHFSGSIDITLQAERNRFWSPSYETALGELVKEIKAVDNVAGVRGLHTFQQKLRELFPAKNDISKYPLNQDPELYAAVSLFQDYSVTESYLLSGENESRIVVTLETLETEKMIQVQKDLQNILQKEKFRNLFKGEINGFSTIRASIFHSLFSGFIKSFIFDFLGILFSFLIFFRSIKWAIVTIIPNLLPLVAVGGLMSLLDMTFDFNLIVLVAIVLGITVDDTTHFIYHLRDALKSGQSMQNSIRHAIKETSVSLVSTTFVFVMTLPAFYLTSVLMFNQVATILILALLLGLFGDMILLPALLSSRRFSQFMGAKYQ